MRQRLRTSLGKRVGSLGTMPVRTPMLRVLALVCTILTVGTAMGISSRTAGAQNTIPKTKTTMRISRGWIGVHITCDPGKYPVLISVEPGSPAHNAGLTAGDTILSSNGVNVRGNSRFLGPLNPGDRIALKLRKNVERSATIIAAKREEAYEVEVQAFVDMLPMNGSAVIHIPWPDLLNAFTGPIQFQRRIILLGAELADLNDGLASALKVKGTGVLILQVAPESPAQASGLQSGDVIFKVDTVPVASSTTLLNSVQKVSVRSLKLDILRQGKHQQRTLRW